MMGAALDSAAQSVAAVPENFGYQGQRVDEAPRGLWLEFGVGSGKTTAYISWKLKSLFTKKVILHGFDSFRGLPSSWVHTKLGTGTFTMRGQIPEHLQNAENVRVHEGLFSETLKDLDVYGSAPVAFA